MKVLTLHLTLSEDITLESGSVIKTPTVAYQMYGKINSVIILGVRNVRRYEGIKPRLLLVDDAR